MINTLSNAYIEAQQKPRQYSARVYLDLNTPAELRAWLPTEIAVLVMGIFAETAQEAVESAKAYAIGDYVRRLYGGGLYWHPNNWDKVEAHLSSGKPTVKRVSEVLLPKWHTGGEGLPI